MVTVVTCGYLWSLVVNHDRSGLLEVIHGHSWSFAVTRALSQSLIMLFLKSKSMFSCLSLTSYPFILSSFYRSFYSNKIRTVSNEQFKDIAPSIRFLWVWTNCYYSRCTRVKFHGDLITNSREKMPITLGLASLPMAFITVQITLSTYLTFWHLFYVQGDPIPLSDITS